MNYLGTLTFGMSYLTCAVSASYGIKIAANKKKMATNKNPDKAIIQNGLERPCSKKWTQFDVVEVCSGIRLLKRGKKVSTGIK